MSEPMHFDDLTVSQLRTMPDEDVVRFAVERLNMSRNEAIGPAGLPLTNDTRLSLIVRLVLCVPHRQAEGD
jgi:hypothetical protein